MSDYIISQKAIKISDLEKIFWSNDENLKKKIISSIKFQNIEDDGIPIKDWLENILKWLNLKEKTSDLIYALNLIVDEIWIDLPYKNDINIWYESDFIEKYLKQDFSIEKEISEIFFWNKNNFFINFWKEPPFFWIVDLEDLKELQKIFSKVNISEKDIINLNEIYYSDSEDDLDEEKWYSYEHIKWIKENIDFCVKNKLDLISFCY